MNDYIWLVGGGLMQVPMAKEIKKQGYKLSISDYNPDCICRQYTDEFILADIYNPEQTLNEAKKLGIKPIAVLSPATDAGPTVSLLAEEYDCHAASYNVAIRVKDKSEVRWADKTVVYTRAMTDDNPAHRISVPGVKDELLENMPFHRWSTVADSYNVPIFPCVIKPTNFSGSVGFRIARDIFEFKRAMNNIKNQWSLADIIIEEYLESVDIISSLFVYDFHASEVAIDCFVLNENIYAANAALRFFWGNRPGIEAGHFNPFTKITPGMMESITNLAKKLDVTWGPFKVDFMLTKKYGWVVMEAATRLSGGFDHMYTCPIATGKDLTREMLRMAVEGIIDHKRLLPSKHLVACCYSPIYEPGTIERWDIKCSPDKLFITEQDEIPEIKSNRDRHVYIINVADNQEDALQKCLDDARMIEPTRTYMTALGIPTTDPTSTTGKLS